MADDAAQGEVTLNPPITNGLTFRLQAHLSLDARVYSRMQTTSRCITQLWENMLRFISRARTVSICERASIGTATDNRGLLPSVRGDEAQTRYSWGRV